MALDKVVDSAKLDGALALTADAIRGKNGINDSLVWDQTKGFEDEIKENTFIYGVSQLSKVLILAPIANAYPNKLIVDVSNISTFGTPQDWNIDFGIRTLILRGIGSREISLSNNVMLNYGSNYLRLIAEENHGINTLIIEDAEFKVSSTGQMYHFFNYWYDLERVEGALNFSSVSNWTYGNWFIGSKLKHIRCVPNTAVTIGALDFGYPQTLDDDSLISICNCCYENPENSRTLKLHSTKKTRCQQILGDSVLTEGGYHDFAPSENGSITLSDFVTNVKGWTIA